MRVSEEHVTHPDAAFRVLALELPAFAGARHRHPQAELTWVRRGHGVRFVGDSAEPFGDGDLVLLGPQVPHLWAGHAGAGEPPFSACVLQWSPALLAQPAWPELHALQPLLARARHGLALSGDVHAAVTDAMAAMPAAAPLERLGLLMRVFGALHRGQAGLRPLSRVVVPAGEARTGAGRIDRVIDWLHAHLHDELSVADAAAVAHVSPAAFSRFFKRETGKAWNVYVNDVRCSEAAVRLRLGSRAVAQVAQDCGYRTLSHFSREFAARFEHPPGRWRRRG